jgi:alpha-amylase/4-alpha-glucanotransferase-like protein
LSLFTPLELRPEPEAELWTFPIETVAKSERGFDRTRQGDSVTLRWPVRLGEASVRLTLASLTLTAEVDPARRALTLGLADSAAVSAEP